MKRFSIGFIEKFFPSFLFGSINTLQLFDQISVQELMEAVSFCEKELDTGLILKTMSDDDIEREIQSFMHLEYVEQRAKTLRADMLEFFSMIIAFKQSFSKDTPEYEQLNSEMAHIDEFLSLPAAVLHKRSKILHNAEALLGESI